MRGFNIIAMAMNDLVAFFIKKYVLFFYLFSLI